MKEVKLTWRHREALTYIDCHGRVKITSCYLHKHTVNSLIAKGLVKMENDIFYVLTEEGSKLLTPKTP